MFVKILFVVLWWAHAGAEFVCPPESQLIKLSKQQQWLKQQKTTRISCNWQNQQRAKPYLLWLVSEHAEKTAGFHSAVWKGNKLAHDGKYLIGCDILHDCQICMICLKSHRGWVFLYQQTSARRKNKEPKEVKSLPRCNATVIKEIDRRRKKRTCSDRWWLPL